MSGSVGERALRWAQVWDGLCSWFKQFRDLGKASFLSGKTNRSRLHLPGLSHGATVKTQRNAWKCSDKTEHCLNECKVAFWNVVKFLAGKAKRAKGDHSKNRAVCDSSAP